MKTKIPAIPFYQAEATEKALAERLATTDEGLAKRALVNLAEMFVGRTAESPDEKTRRATVCVVVGLALDGAELFNPKTATLQ